MGAANAREFAVEGLKKASNKVAVAANNIVNADTNGASLDTEMIDMLAASQSYKANASVIATTKRMDEALGRIFDEKA